MIGTIRPKTRRQLIPKRHLVILESTKPNRRVYYTPQFRNYMKKNIGITTQTYKFVLKNLRNFRGGTLSDPKTRIIAEMTHTGSYSGAESITFKITHKNKQFFMKLIPEHMEHNEPQTYTNVDRVFRSIKNRIGRYNVALIRPHLIYCPKSQDAFRVIITDFFNKGEVIHLAEEGINKKEFKTKFSAEIDKLSELAIRNGIADLDQHNFFYHKKSRTLLFFDPA